MISGVSSRSCDPSLVDPRAGSLKVVRYLSAAVDTAPLEPKTVKRYTGLYDGHISPGLGGYELGAGSVTADYADRG
jgi:hypothetical protein